MAKKTKKTRFVPPMILGSAVIASVIPAVVGMTACSDDNGSQQYAVGTGFVAATFDASADTNGFTVAANFDAGTDANGFSVGASFDASPDTNGFTVAANFDADTDANGFTVAANFDAGTDANGFAVGASFDAGGNGGHDSGEG